MRPKGIKGEQTPVGPVLREAEQWLREREEAQAKKAEARANRPVPNYICYPEVWKGRVDNHGNWLDGVSRAPTHCRRCGLYLGGPLDNHQCEGFMPQYPEWDAEKRQWVHWYTNSAEGYVDWDDDQYDPTVDDVHIEKNPDEEDSGCVIEGMTEEKWLERKFGKRRKGNYDY
jgi:hypothetical protein